MSQTRRWLAARYLFAMGLVLAGSCLLAACGNDGSTAPAAPTVDATATAASEVIARALGTPLTQGDQVATAVAATLTASAPTAAPTATVTPPPPTPDATRTVVEVALPTPTDTPQPLPASPAATASCQVDGAFGSLGDEYVARVGCSRNAVEYGAITIEAFEGGYLVWIQAEDRIYAITNDGRWSTHPNSWQAGEASLPCSAAQTYGYPAMGFGKLWCSNATINRMLGAPRGPEEPNDSAQRQLFENGQIFRVQGGRTFVLLYDGTRWIL